MSDWYSDELRVTTDSEYFEQHPDSLELWSPGSPVFPDPSEHAEGDEGAFDGGPSVVELLGRGRE